MTVFNNIFLKWNWLAFYLYYQLIVLKNSIQSGGKILLVTDRLQVTNGVKLIAYWTNNYFSIGPWNVGYLTNIRLYKNIPDFVINFGLNFSNNFYAELKITGIPVSNFSVNINYKKYIATTYSLPNFNNTNMLSRIILISFLIFIQPFSKKKHMNIYFFFEFYELFVLNYFKLIFFKWEYIRASVNIYKIHLTQSTTHLYKNNIINNTALFEFFQHIFINTQTFIKYFCPIIFSYNMKKYFIATTYKKEIIYKIAHTLQKRRFLLLEFINKLLFIKLLSNIIFQSKIFDTQKYLIDDI